VNIGLLGSVGALMIHYAFGSGLMSEEAVADRSEESPYHWWLMPIVFFASIPVAILSPLAATLIWLAALGVAPQLFRRLRAGSEDGE
jgi:hypothetical protein